MSRGEFEARTYFQRHSFAKLSNELFFSRVVAHYGKGSISVFQEIFTSTDNIFILRGGLSTR